MRAFRTALRRFARDRRAHFAFLTIVGLVPITFVLFSIVNSGTAIQDATRSQDAADMVAFVHAAEAARSMNTLAMNHVSLTQNFATAVNASSLDNTITIHEAVLAGAIAEAGIYILLTCNKYNSTPLIGPILFAICAAPSVAYQGELALEIDRVEQIRSRYRPSAAFGIASAALNALNDQDREIVDRFPEAVSEQAIQIARAHRVSDIYFDASCAEGRAASCDAQDPRQGMELPVTVNQPLAAHLTFCAGLFFGTGGLDGSSIPILSAIPGLRDFGGIDLMNGSFRRRGFPTNEGPMYGGPANGDRYLPLHISKTSGIGSALEDYQDMAHETRLYDGLLNLFQTPAELAEFVGDLTRRIVTGRSTRGMQSDAERRARSIRRELIIAGNSTADYMLGPGFAYPADQTEDDNIFITMVELRTAARCLGQGEQGGGGLGGALLGFITQLAGLVGLSTVPDFDVYHPVQGPNSINGVPVIQPDLDDFPDAYRPLAFVFREGGIRWSPRYFQDPNPGFVRYAQAITYNPDEVSLYSQNWRARLIPATRMRDRAAVVARMNGRVPPSFEAFRTDLESVGGAPGWDQLVTR